MKDIKSCKAGCEEIKRKFSNNALQDELATGTVNLNSSLVLSVIKKAKI